MGELERALQALLAAGLLPQSEAAVRHALAVAGIDGLEGTLVIRVPKKSEPPEVRFVTGKARLSLEM